MDPNETKPDQAAETLADQPLAATADASASGAGGHARLLAAFPWLLLAVLVAATALLFALNWAPAIFTPDANGYWAQGSRLATSGRTWFTAESPVQYIGGHWLLTPDGRYISRYPPGLPVLIAAVWKAAGPAAAVAVNPVLGLLAIIGTFVLVRQVLGPWWGLGGALVLATNPVLVRHSLSCDSHIAVTALLVWGVWLLVRWGRDGHWLNAVGAGILLGAIPTVRYPEGLFALGIGVYLLLHYRSRPGIWGHYAAAVAGALVPVTALAVRNQLLLGSFWRTGYALTGEQTGFGWGYFRAHAIQYLRFINSDGLGPLLVLALAGIAIMCWRARDRRLGILLATLILPTTLLYMAYYWAPARQANGTMRFLLPLLPLGILAAAWALHEFTRPLPTGPRATVIAVLLAFQLLWGLPTAWQDARQIRWQKIGLSRIAHHLDAVASPRAVVLAHPQILQHLDYLQEWRLADTTLMRAGRRLPDDAADAPDDADAVQAPQPMQKAKLAARTERYRDLRPIERERLLADDIQQWAAGNTIWYVGTAEQIAEMRGAWFHPDNFTVVARVPLPTRRDDRRDDRPGGAARAQLRQQRPNIWDFSGGADELVIARWTPTWRRPNWLDNRDPRPQRGGFPGRGAPPPPI